MQRFPALQWSVNASSSVMSLVLLRPLRPLSQPLLTFDSCDQVLMVRFPVFVAAAQFDL